MCSERKLKFGFDRLHKSHGFCKRALFLYRDSRSFRLEENI